MESEIFLGVLWLCVVGYVFMQAVVLLRASGQSRLFAALPLVAMVPIFVFTAVAYAQESNLWPLTLLLASPLALLYVIAVRIVQTSEAGRPSSTA
jgi:hypothetical protein